MQCELEHWNSPPRHGAESHATDSVEHVSVYLKPVLKGLLNTDFDRF